MSDPYDFMTETPYGTLRFVLGSLDVTITSHNGNPFIVDGVPWTGRIDYLRTSETDGTLRCLGGMLSKGWRCADMAGREMEAKIGADLLPFAQKIWDGRGDLAKRRQREEWEEELTHLDAELKKTDDRRSRLAQDAGNLRRLLGK